MKPLSTRPTPVRRFLKPAAKELGIKLCGWHDFRHSLTTELRRSGTHPKVVSDLLGHKKVNLAMDVYDRSSLQDFEQALSQVVGKQLLPSCDKGERAVRISHFSGVLVGPPGFEPGTNRL